ncbi:hypothetical protein CRUP_006447 [Coryphaenoides rupestris]|nr:hypothetical protein CRUP_006447 [Coryphaenoides rupestris]
MFKLRGEAVQVVQGLQDVSQVSSRPTRLGWSRDCSRRTSRRACSRRSSLLFTCLATTERLLPRCSHRLATENRPLGGPRQVTVALGRPHTLHLRVTLSPRSHATSDTGTRNSGDAVLEMKPRPPPTHTYLTVPSAGGSAAVTEDEVWPSTWPGIQPSAAGQWWVAARCTSLDEVGGGGGGFWGPPGPSYPVALGGLYGLLAGGGAGAHAVQVLTVVPRVVLLVLVLLVVVVLVGGGARHVAAPGPGGGGEGERPGPTGGGARECRHRPEGPAPSLVDGAAVDDGVLAQTASSTSSSARRLRCGHQGRNRGDPRRLEGQRDQRGHGHLGDPRGDRVPPGPLAGGPPGVMVVDGLWQAGGGLGDALWAEPELLPPARPPPPAPPPPPLLLLLLLGGPPVPPPPTWFLWYSIGEGKIVAQGRLLLQDTFMVSDQDGGLLSRMKERRVFLFEQIVIFSEPLDKKKGYTTLGYLFKNSVKVKPTLTPPAQLLQAHWLLCSPERYTLHSPSAAVSQLWVHQVSQILENQRNFLNRSGADLVHPQLADGGAGRVQRVALLSPGGGARRQREAAGVVRRSLKMTICSKREDPLSFIPGQGPVLVGHLEALTSPIEYQRNHVGATAAAVAAAAGALGAGAWPGGAAPAPPTAWEEEEEEEEEEEAAAAAAGGGGGGGSSGGNSSLCGPRSRPSRIPQPSSRLPQPVHHHHPLGPEGPDRSAGTCWSSPCRNPAPATPPPLAPQASPLLLLPLPLPTNPYPPSGEGPGRHPVAAGIPQMAVAPLVTLPLKTPRVATVTPLVPASQSPGGGGGGGGGLGKDTVVQGSPAHKGGGGTFWAVPALPGSPAGRPGTTTTSSTSTSSTTRGTTDLADLVHPQLADGGAGRRLAEDDDLLEEEDPSLLHPGQQAAVLVGHHEGILQQ